MRKKLLHYRFVKHSDSLGEYYGTSDTVKLCLEHCCGMRDLINMIIHEEMHRALWKAYDLTELEEHKIMGVLAGW